MGEEEVSSLSLSKAKKKDHVIFKPPVKKSINIQKEVCFFTLLTSLFGDKPL